MTFVVMIFSIATLPPASAHAGMNHGEVAHHGMTHQNAAKQTDAKTVSATHECASMSAADEGSSDSSSICCSGICVAGFLSDKHSTPSPEVDYLHTAANVPGLMSMDTEGLLRPPST
ncbi:hypothetical protein [Roseobacter weihaiensis]|uniref:hypothetical protein n=1 Tax=Roseobacter weihaiensis TaxID=2763262 RepID=UPI001D0A76F7|nr:hypothetical protein [Roseobacter sp. H9]